MARVCERRLTQREAAPLLGVSERHVRRLVRAYAEDGAASLVSAKRGKRSVTPPPAPQPLPPVEPPDDKIRRWVAGWVMLGVAGVGFGVAAVTGGLLLSNKDIIEEHCTDGVCDEEGLAEAEDVPVLDIVGSAALALGVTASAVSLVLLLTTPRDDDDARLDWRSSPMVSADAAGGVITGSW